VDAIAEHLGVEEGHDPEVEELKDEVSPEKVMEEMDRVKRESKEAVAVAKAGDGAANGNGRGKR
jgi:hypothetical protein